MRLLDDVCWPELYRATRAGADQCTRGIADAADTPHEAFAHLVAGEHYTVLRALVAGHSTLGLDDAERVGRWLDRTAHCILGERLGGADGPPAKRPPDAGRLHVDPELFDLPHLDLLTDYANRLRRFQVLVRTLPANIHGRYWSHGAIELDPANISRATLHRAFQHELGHAFDLWLSSRTPEQREDYADLVAGLLAAHEPTTVEAMAELAEHAHRTVTGNPRHAPEPEDGLPPAGAESITAFHALPILVTSQR